MRARAAARPGNELIDGLPEADRERNGAVDGGEDILGGEIPLLRESLEHGVIDDLFNFGAGEALGLFGQGGQVVILDSDIPSGG